MVVQVAPDAAPGSDDRYPRCGKLVCRADAGTQLRQLLADERAFAWHEDPLAATIDGVRDYDDRLPRVTPADQARVLASDSEFLARLRAMECRAPDRYAEAYHARKIALGSRASIN